MKLNFQIENFQRWLFTWIFLLNDDFALFWRGRRPHLAPKLNLIWMYMIIFTNFPVLYQLNTFKYGFIHVFQHSDSYKVNETLLIIILFTYSKIWDLNKIKFPDWKPPKMIFYMNFSFKWWFCLILKGPKAPSSSKT